MGQRQRRLVNVARTDVAVRYGPGGWREWIATPLFNETLVPAAAPRLAETLGPEPSAREVLRHPLIHDTYMDAWRTWLAGHGHSYRPRPQDRRFPDYDLVLHAAAAGCGVALLRQPYGNAFVENGSLVRLCGIAIANPMRLYALTRAGPKRRPVELLIQRLASL